MGISIKIFILAVALFAANLLIYYPVFNGFFQQDEWLGFARFITHQRDSLPELIRFIFSPFSLHYTPLAFLSGFLLFSTFHLNYQAYAAVSIFLHFLSSVLVFHFSKMLFRSYKYGILAALLFVASAAGFQATAWPVADLAVHGATIFGLLSLIFALAYIEKNKLASIGFSALSFLVSLLFKEITIALILLIPFIFYLFSEKALAKSCRAIYLFISIGLIYIFVRGFLLFAFQNTSSVPVLSSATQPLSAASYNLITFPAKALSQSVFPQGLLLKLSKYISYRLPDHLTGEKFTSTYNIFVEQKTLEVLSLLIFLILAGMTFIFWKNNTKDRTGKILGFGLVFILFNSIIFVFSPERIEVINIIDSRNLYFLSIGMVLMVVALVDKVCRGNLNKAILYLLPLFLLNLYFLRLEITHLTEQGALRRSLLSQIKEEYPQLPPKVIFYTTSDYAYYGVPVNDKILPFQSGLGQTLLVWYEKSEQFPKDFYNKRFLWDIREQGYYENNGKGFGYFRDYSKLLENMIKYHLPVDSIISFSWSHKNSTLTNTTSDIQKQLKSELIKEN